MLETVVQNPDDLYGPTLEISQAIHTQKYRAPNETYYDAMCRIAAALAHNEQHRKALLNGLLDMRILFGGRIQSAAGAARIVTAMNCLRGDAEIITLEHGVVPIADVVNTTVSVYDGNGNWTPSFIYHHGKQEVFRTVWKGFHQTKEVYATAEHDWVLTSGDKRTTKKIFTKNTRSHVADNMPVKPSVDNDAYRLGVYHGLVYGDGTIGEGVQALYVSVNDIPDMSVILEGVPFSTPPSRKGARIYYFNRTAYPVDMKELPEDTSSLSYKLGFVRGWFAADGCVSTQPEASICVDKTEETWLRRWGPTIGFQFNGWSVLADTTNYGKRNETNGNLRFRPDTVSVDDLLLNKHKSRWKNFEYLTAWYPSTNSDDYVSGGYVDVYCPYVPTTNTFALGSGIHSANCYVSQRIEDNTDSIFNAVHNAFRTMRLGGGIGYDFSELRPEGDIISSLDSRSSGPISFMHIFDTTCQTVSSAGHRRGAQMAVLRVDHPDIEAFINAKHDNTTLTNFNISIGVTDEFMHAVKNNLPFDLRFNGRVYKTVSAAALWDQILRSTWDYAEPGVLFIDRINDMNNLWYAETIKATNPCGEQPLPPYGCCLLGSLNLVKYITEDRKFDFDMFKNDVRIAVMAMDRVIDTTTYPLAQQRDEQHNKRRIGLGVTGLANAIEIIGHPYGSKQFLSLEEKIFKALTYTAYETSIEMAKRYGPFPLFDKDKYLQGKFIQQLPERIQRDIAKHGIRNSHLISIAPTGTISLCADNVSGGIEPVFDYVIRRPFRFADGTKREVVYDDYAYREFGVKGKTNAEVTVEEHVQVLAIAQKYTDSAVSKTVNVGDDVSWDAFKDVYMSAYDFGCKGITTFRLAGKRFGLISSVKEEHKDEEVAAAVADDAESGEAPEAGACTYDPATGIRTCDGA